MCGIAGILRFDGAPVEEATLRSMAAQLVHRGPDAEGVWIDGSVGFSHRRLSIIDVDGSPQPMPSRDERYHVTFHGEILNYRDLRKQLDYPWRWNGDTEVLLAAFAERGTGSFKDLHGQFAYALHDVLDNELFLVRDRLGILPLFYYVDSHMLAFASEVKALLPALPRYPEVDEESLGDYLAHRCVPAPHTLFRGIRKLLPGHWLRANGSGKIEVEKYWEVPRRPKSLHLNAEQAVQLVSTAMERAVDEALVADVPVGALLSGGMDSSLIVALMAERADPAGIDTFAAVFGDPRYDEGVYAAAVAREFGTRHHEVTVAPDDFLSRWHELTRFRDAPLSEPADVAVNSLALEAQGKVKVLLSGEGSDELFGGYPKYLAAGLTAAAAYVPARLRAPALQSLQRHLPAQPARLRIAARALGESTEADRLRAWFSPFTEAERMRLLGRPGRDPHTERWARSGGDAIQRMQYLDSHAWLSDNLLERGDRMTMAASVELRPPFLDQGLVDLAFALPSRFKVRRGQTKWILRRVAEQRLPQWVVRRPKLGFRVPIDRWFRGGLREMAHDMLLSPSSFVGRVMDPEPIHELLARHDRERSNEEIRIWTLLCLEVWHEVFFGAASRPPAPSSTLVTGTQVHPGQGTRI
jgi:asparagine synthase (glutamine-hydrolysing)